jgi:hypothetical protein
MACSDYSVTIFVDGVPLSGKDNGCKGDSHLFTLETTLPSPVAYKWTLDYSNTILSTESHYTYTFDDKVHYLKLWATTTSCQILKTITVKGNKCVSCDIGCLSQTANIPAGTIKMLIDETGKKYPLDDNIITKCGRDQNTVAGKAIKRAIRQQTKCLTPNLSASVYYNQPLKSCLTVTINNSPIRFRYIQVDNNTFSFDLSNC